MSRHFARLVIVVHALAGTVVAAPTVPRFTRSRRTVVLNSIGQACLPPLRVTSFSFHLFYYRSEENVNLVHSKKPELNCELVGSWTVEVGDLDQALHLWQYTGGYERVDHAQVVLSKDEV